MPPPSGITITLDRKPDQPQTSSRSSQSYALAPQRSRFASSSLRAPGLARRQTLLVAEARHLLVEVGAVQAGIGCVPCTARPATCVEPLMFLCTNWFFILCHVSLARPRCACGLVQPLCSVETRWLCAERSTRLFATQNNASAKCGGFIRRLHSVELARLATRTAIARGARGLLWGQPE